MRIPGTRTVRLTVIALSVALAVPLVVLPAAGQNGAPDSDNDTYRQLKLFGDVFERVRADYVEEVSDKELIEAAINGMLTSLDPHSAFLNAESFQDMQVQTKGEFGGLGIEVTMENGFVKVVSPIDGTPAYRAGLQAGDFITHLDGEAVLGLTLADAVDRMRGKVGTDITLTVRREEQEPFDVTITRDVIKIQSVRSQLEGNIGYLRITTFNEQTFPGVERELTDLREQANGELSGLVLDLRNNPGGLLDQAIAVSDAFLDRGEIVSTRGRDEADSQRWNARSGDLAAELPIVVLINAGSASASEIVAGALQDHRRAIVMGTKSFGKGSVQTIIPVQGQSAIRLTTARYYTPSGRSIQAKGIEPDIIVQQATIETNGQRRLQREADLRGALENPDGGEADDAVEPEAQEPPAGADEDGAGEGTEAETESEQPITDYQLARALDLLRGLNLYNQRLAD
jgi:carboxyl-terminal processing protease